MAPEQQTKFTTSFIPKKPVAPTVTKYNKGSNFLNIITIAIFLGTLVFSGGVYLYKLNVQRQINGQIETLKKARAEFDENFIQSATRLNSRIIAVKNLIDTHKAPSEVFSLLQQHTLDTVRFNNFTYSTDKSDGSININANGVGLGYPSIVLQSDEFGQTGSLKDVVFSSVQPNDSGLVNFTFKSELDKAMILYRKTLMPVTDSWPTENKKDEVSFNNFFR